MRLNITKIRFLAIFFSAAALLCTASGSIAQNKMVSQKKDWSVFKEDSSNQCWSVSAPKSTRNTRNGKTVSVRRGEILLYVTHKTGLNPPGELAFTGGYPFAKGSKVKVTIEGQSYELFTQGEWAWPHNPDEDRQLIQAMEKGNNAVLVAKSSLGTQTTDTFSLSGFTAANAEAMKACQ